jgi:uncharacterized protein (DUF433 family)
MRYQRITVDPAQMDGVPCIRGLRIPVATVVGMVAGGMAEAEILAAYPDLQAGDVQEACNTRRTPSARESYRSSSGEIPDRQCVVAFARR